MAEQKRRLVMDIVAPPPAPETPIKKRGKWHSPRNPKVKLPHEITNARAVYILGAIAVVVIIVIAIHLRPTPHKSPIADTSTFPANTIQQIHGFKFYYLKPSFQTDFALQRDTITIQSGVLVFEMRNPAGKTLVFTEETTPPNYDVSSLNTTTKFYNEYGQAFITDETNRTTGTLFTQDNTWILINAPNPIGVSSMKQILDALTPVSPST